MRETTQILEVFESIRSALLSNDVQALELLLAKDYLGFDPSGNPQDKQMVLNAYQPGAARIDKYDLERVEARVVGDVGIITGEGHIEGTYVDTLFEHSLRFLDLYVYREDNWQLYMSQVTPLRSV